MTLWNEATREDITKEIIPGVETVDWHKVEQLDWVSFLSHMGEMVKEGTNRDTKAVIEHFDDLTFMLYGERIRAERGSYPDAAEIMAFRNRPATKERIQKLTKIAAGLTKENWNAFVDYTCGWVGIDAEEFRQTFG